MGRCWLHEWKDFLDHFHINVDCQGWEDWENCLETSNDGALSMCEAVCSISRVLTARSIDY